MNSFKPQRLPKTLAVYSSYKTVTEGAAERGGGGGKGESGERGDMEK